MECFMCGEEGEFDAIYNQEMVKICRICAEKAGIPVIKRPSADQMQAAEKPFTVQERLARLSGVKPKTKLSVQIPVRKEFPRIERSSTEELKRLNLIDNFHWYIIRARRARGLSIRQMGLALKESEKLLLQIEHGSLPGNALPMIEKIEEFLKISLRNKGKKKENIKIIGNKENLLGSEIEIYDEA